MQWGDCSSDENSCCGKDTVCFKDGPHTAHWRLTQALAHGREVAENSFVNRALENTRRRVAEAGQDKTLQRLLLADVNDSVTKAAVLAHKKTSAEVGRPRRFTHHLQSVWLFWRANQK